MPFETGESHLYLIALLALAAQCLILGLVALLWLLRRSRGGLESATATRFSSKPRVRGTVLAAGGVLAVSILTAFVFLVSHIPSRDPDSVVLRTSTGVSTVPQLGDETRPASESAYRRPAAFEPTEPERGRDDSRSDGDSGKFLRARASRSPGLKTSLPTPTPYTYLDLVSTWLREGPEKHKPDSVLVHRAYERLVQDYGFKGSEETLHRLLSTRQEESREPGREARLLLESGCGREAAVTWGEKSAVLGGQKRPVFLFSLRSRWSRAAFVRAYADGRLETFLEAHRQAFESFGGGFAVIAYEELPEPLLRKLKEPLSREAGALHELSLLYHFIPKWESGQNTERVATFSPDLVHSFEAESLDALNTRLGLMETPPGREGQGRFHSLEEERFCLSALPPKTALQPEAKGMAPLGDKVILREPNESAGRR